MVRPLTRRPAATAGQRSRRAVAFVAAVGACWASACGGPVTTHAAGSVHRSPGAVTVAVEAPLSGAEAATGEDLWRGAQLAAARLDGAGGVAGRRIDLVAADDRGDPAAAATVARQLVARRVAAVVGPFDPGVADVVLPRYRQAGIPVVRLTATDPGALAGATTRPVVRQLAAVDAQELEQVLHVHRVAVLRSADPTAAALVQDLTGLLGSSGVVVPVSGALAPGADPAGALAQVAGGAVDAVVLAMEVPQAAGLAAECPGRSRCRHCRTGTVPGGGRTATGRAARRGRVRPRVPGALRRAARSMGCLRLRRRGAAGRGGSRRRQLGRTPPRCPARSRRGASGPPRRGRGAGAGAGDAGAGDGADRARPRHRGPAGAAARRPRRLPGGG